MARTAYFNPRSSCEERLNCVTGETPAKPFQSTLLMRGATPLMFVPWLLPSISIHAPHARSDDERADIRALTMISIHAPHARSDVMEALYDPAITFQSTLLMRGATMVKGKDKTGKGIFQSTLLMRGATEPTSLASRMQSLFQSTLLMRGATSTLLSEVVPVLEFQSTLLMRGATRWFNDSIVSIKDFNPRSSCEERQGYRRGPPCASHISIHAPHARSDKMRVDEPFGNEAFQSTLLMRGAT